MSTNNEARLVIGAAASSPPTPHTTPIKHEICSALNRQYQIGGTQGLQRGNRAMSDDETTLSTMLTGCRSWVVASTHA